VSGFYKCGNKRSCSMKGEKFLDKLKGYQSVIQIEFCSVEFVNFASNLFAYISLFSLLVSNFTSLMSF
jgi:hypothetical protein